MDSNLTEVFVPYIPQEGPCNRDLTLADSWKLFVNAFNTWMDQAQNLVALSDSVACVRVGKLVCVTGYIKKNEKISCVAPVASFSEGNVLFSVEGFIRNDGDGTSINATYIAKE